MLLALLLTASVAPAPSVSAPDQQVSSGAPIPPDIKDMLDAAIASGNDSEVGVVAKYATKAAPDSAKTINDTVTAWREAQTAAHEAKVEAADFLDLWTGKASLGGWLSTGNSPNSGVSAAVDLDRPPGQPHPGADPRLAGPVALGQQQTGAALAALVVVDLQRQRGLAAVHRAVEEHQVRRRGEAAAVTGGGPSDAVAAVHGAVRLDRGRLGVDASRGDVVRVTVVYRAATEVPLVGRLVGDVTLRSTAVMRPEP